MDPQTDLPSLTEDLEVNIDELTAALTPLLDTPTHTLATTLPLLDKAKLYVLSAYAIESLLFSTLQASGANAKEHAVFAELARLKGYFGKIKEVEAQGQAGEPKTRLDKEAAARFIKHGLAGNERYDLERAERVAKEKARAALKARQMHIRFEEKEKDKAAAVATETKKRTAEEQGNEEQDSSDNHISSENEAFYGPQDSPTTSTTTTPAQKKPRLSSAASDPMHLDTKTTPSSSTTPITKKSKKKKDKKKKSQNQSDDPNTKPEEAILPTRAPRTHSETFSSLLDGSFKEKHKSEGNGNGNRNGNGNGKGRGKARGK